MGPVEGKLGAFLLASLGLTACGPAVGVGSSGNDAGSSGGAAASTGTTADGLDTTGGEPTATTAVDSGSAPDNDASTSTGAVPVGPDEVIEGCEGQRFRLGSGTETPVHALSVKPGQAEFDVQWSLPGNGVLVLSSYDPIRWRVTLEGEGTLDRIVVNGFGDFTIDAPAGVDVQVLPEPDVHLWVSRYPTVSGERMRRRIEYLLEMPVTGMDVCGDEATAATITPHNALGPAEPPPAEGCEELLGSTAHFCVFSLFSVARYIAVNPSGGERCTANQNDNYFDALHGGFGVTSQLRGYLCSHSPYVEGTTLAEVDLESGFARWSDRPCHQVATSSWGRLIVYQDERVTLFDDFDAVVSNNPLADYEIGPTDALGGDADTLYQLADESVVHRWTLETGEYIDSFPIGPIGTHDGFGAMDGLLLSRDSDGLLHTYDSESGVPLDVVDVGTAWPGEFSCVNRPPT